MKPTQACLTPEVLHQLVGNRLADAGLLSVEEHLNECPHCRALLDGAESDHYWRQEIASVLRSAPERCADGSIDPDTFGEHSPTALLRLLGPTDDPRMLGRIGSYEVVGIIGRGGMGVVFKAFDGALNRYVAIKMLSPNLAEMGAARKRFAREGQAAAAVIDDHVLPIYSVAEWQGVPYLVMQYSRGSTLQKRVEVQGPLELKEILRIGMQTARGLAAAHALGLVHRDVKPSNILIDGTVERALLTDFGLARAVDDASITRTGTIAGTPQYMSPEQACGTTVDARSDLFSLGGVLYYMATGRQPFRADNSYAVLRLIIDQEPRSMQEINPDLPVWLCTLISHLMAKDPENRPASAEEVAEILQRCLAHVQQPAAVALPAFAHWSMKESRSGRRPWSLSTGLVFALLVALVAVSIYAGFGIVRRFGGQAEALRAKAEALEQKLEVPATSPHKIVVTSPQSKDVVVIRQYVGKVLVHRHVTVCAQPAGVIAEVLVREGQAVKLGDVLFKVAPARYQAKLDAEAADLRVAKLELDNDRKLFEQKVISQQEMALSEAKVARAEAQTKLAEAELASTVVRAPFDGLIGRLQEQEGNTIKEGTVLTTLFDNSAVSVYFSVPEARYLELMSNRDQVKEGQPVELVLASSGKFPHTGKLAAIDGQFEKDTGTIAFRADFPNPESLLCHGQSGTVSIRESLKNSVVIPHRAIFEYGDRQYVYVVGKGDVAHRREILVRNELEDQLVIDKGLTVNDRIVVDGVRLVRDGEKVEYEFRKPEESPAQTATVRLHERDRDESAFRDFDSNAVSEGASSTWRKYVQWWNSTKGTPLESSAEIPRLVWATSLVRLDPKSIYSHGSNIVIVRSQDESGEEGIYVALGIASAHGPNDDQFIRTLIAHAPDGDVYTFRRKGSFKPASQTVQARIDGTTDPNASAAEPTKSPLLLDKQVTINAGLEYLARNQQEDGSWTSGDDRGNVAVTALAGRAFLAAGDQTGRGPNGVRLTKAIEYILRNEVAGLLAEGRFTPMYEHGQAVHFLAEAFSKVTDKVLQDRMKGVLSRAVTVITDSQNREGGWRYRRTPRDADISVTCCQLHALAAAQRAGFDVPQTTIDQGIKYILSCRDLYYGDRFRYMPKVPSAPPAAFEYTAEAISALNAVGYTGDKELMERGTKFIRSVPLSDVVDTHFYEARYHAAQVMKSVGREDWEAWYSADRDDLLGRRNKDGGWGTSLPSSYSDTAFALIVLHSR